MNIYTYEELIPKPKSELIKIKKQAQESLHKIYEEKNVIISNILSLQGMISEEEE